MASKGENKQKFYAPLYIKHSKSFSVNAPSPRSGGSGRPGSGPGHKIFW